MGTVTEIEPSEDEYREMLNGIYDPVEVCGCTFNAGDVLAELDPIAFRCWYNDYCSESVRYSCDECGRVHDDEDDAKECCPDDEED